VRLAPAQAFCAGGRLHADDSPIAAQKIAVQGAILGAVINEKNGQRRLTRHSNLASHNLTLSAWSALRSMPCAAPSTSVCHTTGKVKKKVEPSPWVDSTQIVPPWRSTTRLTMVSPAPVPSP